MIFSLLVHVKVPLLINFIINYTIDCPLVTEIAVVPIIT